MTTILLTEAIDQAGVDLLAVRVNLRLIVAPPGDPAFGAALTDALAIGARVVRLDQARLGRLPRGAIVVNCARGGIVDEEAVAQALGEGAVAAAALDVFEQEPVARTHRLASFDSVVLTPHSAATTREGARAMAIAMAQNILDGIDGRLNPSCVVDPASAAWEPA